MIPRDKSICLLIIATIMAMTTSVYANLTVDTLLPAQTLVCGESSGGLYSEEGSSIFGYSIAANAAGDGYYVAGHRDGELLIMAMSLGGDLLWSRSLDVVPELDDHPISIITDSEGMIGISGIAAQNPHQGGPAFVLRFDPNTQTVLWASRLNASNTSDRVHGLMQNGPGGAYLLLSNNLLSNHDDAQLTLFDLNTGVLTTGQTRNINLVGSETLWELVHHDGRLYGVGRYTDGGSSQDMRHVITALDPTTLDAIWTKLGHRAGNVAARLYGYDLVIDNSSIYSGYYGDADGNSTTSTEMYIQKTSLDGEVIWLKKYDLPTPTDWGYEIVKSGEGIVVFAANRNTNGSLYLYKIDADGNLLWAKEYDVDGNVNTETLNIGSSQLIAVGDRLIFTATSTMSTGEFAAVVIETNANGEVVQPCFIAVPVTVMVEDVENAVFYDVQPIATNIERPWSTLSPGVTQVEIGLMSECVVPDNIEITLNASICEGQTFEGYTASGTYEDAFVTPAGCDSVRTLHLTVVNCGCESIVTGIYGTEQMIERGYSLSPTAEGDGFYICGVREDSVLILKRNLQGLIEWAVAIDVHPNRMDHPVSIITDTEGMIGIVGMSAEILYSGGEPFALRFNPYSQQLMWLRQFDTPVSRDRVHSIYQHPDVADGDYLMLSNPVINNPANDDFLITVIDMETGVQAAGGSHRFDFKSADFILDLATYQGELYGVGRYTDGEVPPKMRNTLTKLDPQTFTPEWTRLGHLPESVNARLYGFDIVVDNGFIYSGYYGDDDGESIQNTKLWLQKTTMEGEIIWLKQYDTPGSRDLGYEIIKQGNGFVVLAVKNRAPGEFYLFKIDTEGNVQWANSYAFEAGVNTFIELFGASQLISVGNQLVFTGYTEEANGDENVLVVQTDSLGRFNAPCIVQTPIDLPVIDEINIVFYDITPTVTTLVMPGEELTPVSVHAMIPALSACAAIDTVITYIEETICLGDAYEGYTDPGVYEDVFMTTEGCDSLRVLTLLVEDCCNTQMASVYGEPGIVEYGLSISRALNNAGYYVAGSRADSVLIMCFTKEDDLVWSHIMDAVPGKAEYPVALITDSEGMLALTGMATDDPAVGGNPFILRFNPTTQSLLWSHEIESTYDHDRVHAISQNGPGGNYLLSTNPYKANLYNDYQLMEFDPQNGTAITGVAKNFHSGNSSYMFDLIRHGDFLYATGRYSLGVGLDLLRNTITKLDANTFDEVWTRVGYVDMMSNQRIYGYDMLIDNDFIYSGIYGDLNGTSVTQTEVFAQKTTLDGELVWLKEYDLPLNTDFGWDVVKSGDGYVFLANQRSTNGELYLFKINADGDVMWARHYEMDLTINTVSFNIGGDQLISLGDDLVMTASVIDEGGGQDILVIHTDSEGFTDAPCVTVQTIALQAADIPNPQFYEINVVESDTVFNQISHQVQTELTTVPALVACVGVNANETLIEATICNGETYLGYTETGVYIDSFMLPDGCDSFRVLTLIVLDCTPVVYYDLDDCRSYMIDGSIMDYSEFSPEYLGSLDCGEVEATILYRDPPAENKHSCTDGLNGSVAMCISALSTCTYMPGHDASAVFEVTFTPDQDSVITFNKLEFYEKAPANYSWIDGPNGPNNYPRFYGIRILKNGTEVFEQHDINTSLTWALQSYTFNDIPEFTIDGPVTFRVELLPYCPINDGAAVSAWDLEDIRLFASCVPVEDEGLTVGGTIKRWDDAPLTHTDIILSNSGSFESPQVAASSSIGTYMAEQLAHGRGYYFKAERNTNILEGVSTLDLIAFQKHLLGIRPLAALDQIIAADINRDGRINAIDLINLRKALLGMIHFFPNNTSWRFGVKPIQLQSLDVNDFVEHAYIESLTQSSIIDWFGVKVGDLNHDTPFDLNDIVTARNSESYPLILSERIVEGHYTIDVIAGESVRLEGLQLALHAEAGYIADVIAGEINIMSEFFFIDPNGLLKISWNTIDQVDIASGARLFSIRLAGNGASAKLKEATQSINSEIYIDDAVRPIDFIQEKVEPAANQSLQMDIAPNPFSDQFVVSFTSPKVGLVRLEVFNAVGTILYSDIKERTAGSHQQVITGAMIGGKQSLLFCRLMAGDEVVTIKVIGK